MIASKELKVAMALELFLQDRESYYDSGDGPTRQFKNVRSGLARWMLPYVGDRWLYEFTGPVLDYMVHEWIATGQLGRTTVNRYISFVRDFMKFCVRRGYARPEQLTSLLSVDRLRRGRYGAQDAPPRRPVDDDRYHAAMRHLSGIVRPMVKMLYHTGMRPGEVRSMSIRDLSECTRDGRRVILYIPTRHKTAHLGKRRVIPIVGEGLEVLECWLERPSLDPRSDGYVFSLDGYGWDMLPIDRINKEVRAACLAAEIDPWTPMQLRHRFGTNALAKLGNLKSVSPMMGHTNERTTLIYAQPSDEAAIETAFQLAN
jgi:integrase